MGVELEQENQLAGEKLVQTYQQAEELLQEVRIALRSVSIFPSFFGFILLFLKQEKISENAITKIQQ